MPTQRIIISNAPSQKVGIGNISGQQIGLENARSIVIGADPYEGEYYITPSREQQIIDTFGRSMRENLVIAPIPQNYGLITYNGFELTVS